MRLEMRKVAASDAAYMIRSFLLSFRTSRWAGTQPGDIWFDAQRQSFLRLLARPAVSVIVARDVDHVDAQHIAGFLIYEAGQPPIVHYVHTKGKYRKQGVMKFLFAAAGIRMDHRFVVTHLTEDFDDVRKHYRAKGDHLNMRHEPERVRHDERKGRPS